MMIPIRLRNERFIHCDDEEALVPVLDQAPTTRNSHRHNASATSINRDDIEFAKRASPAVHQTVSGEDDVSQSCTASVSTDMQNMVDKLVSSETSEPEQDLLNEGNPNRLSLQSAAMTDAVTGTPRASTSLPANELRASSMEREETIRPVFPSIWNTPFAPLPGEASGSPRTRPSTARQLDLNTNGEISSSGLFRQDLARQQNLLTLQSSPFQPTESSGSWIPQPTFNAKESIVPAAAAAGFRGSGLLESSDFGSSESTYAGPPIANRQADAKHAKYGVIGETPPSGQHG